MTNAPAFRQTLAVFPRNDAPHLFWVQDPKSQKNYSFQDFEVSLARMLNGRRTVADVVAAAAQIGIPVTDRAVEAFIGRLRAQGMLDEEGLGAPLYVAPWPVRNPWTEPQRERFRAALRAYRAGNYPEARTIAEQLLATDPENPAVQQLIGATHKRNGRAFNELLTEHEGHWARAAAEPPAPEEMTDDAPRRSIAPFIVSGVVLLGIAALLIPMPYQIETKGTLLASTETEVKLGQSAFAGPAVVKVGDRIEKGAVLAKPDTAQLEPALKAAEEALVAADTTYKQEQIALGRPKVVRAKKLLESLQAKLTAATADVEAKKAAGGPALAAAQAKEAQLKEAVKLVGAVANPETFTTAETKQKEAKARVEALKAQQAGTGIVSPVGGVITKLSLSSGKELEAGAVVAVVADISELKAVLDLAKPAEKGLEVGQAVTAEVPGVGKGAGEITAVEPKPAALIKNPELTLRPGAEAELKVDAGKRSTLSKILH